MAPTGHAYRLVAWNHAWKVVEPRTLRSLLLIEVVPSETHEDFLITFRACQTELKGSRAVSLHKLRGPVASRCLPTTHMTHGSVASPKVAQNVAGPGRQRAHATRPRSCRRANHATYLTSACAPRLVDHDRPQARCQVPPTAHARPASRR